MAEPQAEQWVPTVDDLRVKLCYVCREEERYDNPENPPRVWTHPCSCTLVAHESCLLQWIKSAQQDAARAPKALKCPQCGATYELESDNPPLLRLLNAVNRMLSAAGNAATLTGVMCLITSVGVFVCAGATMYGAFAVKEFLGEEMYNLLLTDDPHKWPWHAWIHLPLIPVSLVLARTRLFDTFPIVPLLLTWATSPPIRSSSSSSSPTISPASITSSLGWLWRSGRTDPSFTPAFAWPPTPFMAMLLFPIVRIAYRRAFDRLTRWVMGSSAPAVSPTTRIRRIVLAMNNVRIGANLEPPPRANAHALAAARLNAALPNAAGNDNDAALPPGMNPADAPEDDAAADAERTLHVTTSSFGRFVGGALLLPVISARMGTLLLRLSAHSALLRAFLAVRPRPTGFTAADAPRIQLFAQPPDSHAGLARQLGGGLLAGMNILVGGTPTWRAHDPVWWRNTVGLGVFVFTKDCIRLLYLWLTKRELETRHVKNRDFAGVDIKELDLIRPIPDVQADAPAAETQTAEATTVEATTEAEAAAGPSGTQSEAAPAVQA